MWFPSNITSVIIMLCCSGYVGRVKVTDITLKPIYGMYPLSEILSQLRRMLILLIKPHCKIWPLAKQLPTEQTREIVTVGNVQILQWDLMSKINIFRS